MSDDKGAGLDLGAMMNQVMEQAKNVQGKMGEAQERLKHIEVEGTAGGGLVKVVAGGDNRIRSVRIDRVAVDPRDIEMLEDLLVAAVNDALTRVQEKTKAELGQAAGGLDLGGLGSLLGGLGG